jgi:hypothetical protein
MSDVIVYLVRSIRMSSVIITLSTLLVSCTLAMYLNVYNATNDTATVTKGLFRTAIIPPHAAADIGLAYRASEHMVVRR